MNSTQAAECIERVKRYESYSPEDGLLSAERDLIAACETIIQQEAAIRKFVKHIDNLERELTELGNLHTAACEELAEVKAILRGLYP